MLVRVINGADSIFEVDLLILLSNDAMSAEENKAAPITHKLQCLENSDSRNGIGMQNIPRNLYQVYMTKMMLFMVFFPFYIQHNGDGLC